MQQFCDGGRPRRLPLALPSGLIVSAATLAVVLGRYRAISGKNVPANPTQSSRCERVVLHGLTRPRLERAASARMGAASRTCSKRRHVGPSDSAVLQHRTIIAAQTTDTVFMATLPPKSQPPKRPRPKKPTNLPRQRNLRRLRRRTLPRSNPPPRQ